jgi:hypothetical protein
MRQEPDSEPQRQLPCLVIPPGAHSVLGEKPNSVRPTPDRLTPTHSSRPGSASSLHETTSQLSRSPSDRQTSITAERLRKQLRSARLPYGDIAHSHIVPKSIQYTLITEDTIAKVIQEGHSQIDLPKAIECAENAWLRAPKLFATLALIRKGHDICFFMEGEVHDDEMPFRTISTNQRPYAIQGKSGKRIEIPETWSDEELEEFGRMQWWINVHVFESLEHYELEDNIILPFIPLDSSTQKQQLPLGGLGGYSEVFVVRIHSGHHDFSGISKSEVMECNPYISNTLTRDRNILWWRLRNFIQKTR